jgi:hypothetical protein
LQQIVVERCSTGNEQVDLHRGCLVDGIRRRPILHGATQCVFIDVELILERSHQCGHCLVVEIDYDVDVESRARLTGK